ncbi:Methionine aminopeptidase 1 [uncultured Clostridium sp.]|nr:Methionine aminopeptidase 1 [uncultured Clostridium sp.]
MRKANALSAAALKYGGEHIEAGMTTWELDKLIYDFIVKHGGIPNFKGLYGFPGTACISLNDTIIHGIPSHDIVIRPGDIVSIDTGAKIDGFNGDNACTYAVGKVDLEAQRVPGMTIAIEPMICQYDCKITQSKDGWTVKTKDGGLAAHFEHSNAILKDHTEIMTRFWDDPDFDPEKFSLK